MTKHEEMQAFYHHYKRVNKKSVVTMAEVAHAAILQGWPTPPPVSGEERLTKNFVDAAREEIRYDKKTKRPYRANLAMTQRLKNGKQLALWIDTDDATRSQMVLAISKYREQMVGEAEIGTNTVGTRLTRLSNRFLFHWTLRMKLRGVETLPWKRKAEN
jgi:hypothetical protein